VYQIFTVPSSTASIATGINGAGLIVGVYQDLSGVLRGFANNGGTFSNVDFPGASGTQAIGVNNAGQIVGDYFDAANVEHGFVSSGGIFTAIDLPGATRTTAAGINAAGDIVGVWSDATGSHGFLLQAGVFTPVDFPLATSTSAFGITDTGEIAGFMTTPPATLTALSAPAGPSAPWTSPAPAAPPDTHQERGIGDGRVHRRPDWATRPHRPISRLHAVPSASLVPWRAPWSRTGEFTVTWYDQPQRGSPSEVLTYSSRRLATLRSWVASAHALSSDGTGGTG
jgi:hypothetical protein